MPRIVTHRDQTGEAYYVFVDDPTRHARIHFAQCRHCNHGQGRQVPGQEPGDWSGTFETYAEAWEHARQQPRLFGRG